MKKIYSYALGVLMVFGGFVAIAPAHASAAVFNNNAFGVDCPTVEVANATNNTPTDSNNCWTTSATATQGNVVNAIIYYHNNGSDTATNVIARLSPESAGASTSQTFTGSISADNASAVSGSGTISINPGETITFGTVKWYKDKESSPTPLPNGQTGAELFSSGLNLGSVPGYTTCPVVNNVRDAACHEGWLMVSYTVGTTAVSNPCTVSISALDSSIWVNNTDVISWTSQNCTSVSVNGPGISSTALSSSGQNTADLTQASTYTITGYGSDGTPATDSVTVNVTNPVTQTCSISSFNGPGTVANGATAALTWNTVGCTSLTVSGTNVSYSTSNASTVASGTTYTGAVYGTTVYTLTASGSNTVTAQTTVSTNSIVNNTCSANLTAAQTEVTSGQTTTLSWYSSGCTYLTVSGPNGTLSSQLSGSVQTAPIYGTQTYTLTAGGSNTVSQSVTIYPYNNNNGSAPTAQTLAATTSGGTTATLNGYVSSNNSTCTYSYLYSCNSGVNYSFEYGTSQYSLNLQTPVQTTSVTSGNVSAYVSNLLPNTTYYFEVVASNTYGTTYGGVLSFVTNNGASGISAITTVPTNVVANSARLNGLITGSNGGLYTGAVSAYFMYGTTPSLGLQTSTQPVNVSSITNYFDTITTSPNTTYYYAIVAVSNGQTYQGSTVSFTTPGYVSNNTNTTTTVYRQVLTGTGGGSAFVSLSITDQTQSIFPSDDITYTVNYQNISGLNLSNAVLNVILPTGVTFRQSSEGILTTNNTVATTLGTLAPNAEGTITIEAVTNADIVPGNNLVTTATLAFTLPSNAQDSAVAYDVDNVVSQNNLAGLALFGNGFFPTSLLGWILLIGLLLIIILIARYFYDRSEAQRRAAMAPVTHVHYDTPPTANTHTGYHGDNLPH